MCRLCCKHRTDRIVRLYAHGSRLASRPSHEETAPEGYDVVILSDLLHFDASHDVLLWSLAALLKKTADARTYVAAGKYTPGAVCERFLREGEKLGLVWEEGEEDAEWRGALSVRGGGLDREQLGVRKGMCRWWVGRWAVPSFGGGAAGDR